MVNILYFCGCLLTDLKMINTTYKSNWYATSLPDINVLKYPNLGCFEFFLTRKYGY